MSRNSRVILKDLLSPDQKASLEAIYLSREVATDQLRRVPSVLAEILDAFHAATGRVEIDASLLLRYIFNRRKLKDWPRLGKRAGKFEPVESMLTASELSALQTIYEGMDETADNLLFSAGMLRRVAQQFREATGNAIAGSVLVAVIVAKRKRGLWVCLRKGEKAFGDIGEVAKKYKTA